MSATNQGKRKTPAAQLLTVRVTSEELLALQDAVDDAAEDAPVLVRVALQLHALTGEELPPHLETATWNARGGYHRCVGPSKR
jgi:hypothetical protein